MAEAPHEPAIELRDVVKRYPSPDGTPVLAVDHVSLTVDDGEFFALLGPSGCGKSTLLRLVAGLDDPTSGSVLVQGRDMRGTPPYRRPVNTVFQSYALFPHLTVFQNVAFGLEMARRPKDEIRRRVAEALDLVRLPDVAVRKPGQLSGGQQQRVALARALVNRPAVLLLDEPLGALDLKLRKTMQRELKTLHRQVGITFVYVTHDQEEALAMATRIGVMDRGRLLQVGTPTEIYERPRSRFVADFIGETNFVEGRLVRLDEGFGVVAVDGGVELVGRLALEAAIGSPVTYSVRPEKIRALVEPPGDGPNRLAAVVEDVAYIGSDTRAVMRTDGGLALAIWEPNTASTLDPGAYFAPGERVWLTWRTANGLILEC